MYVANSRPLYMCVFLGTAAPLPNSVGITAVRLLSGDVEVTFCSIPETLLRIGVDSFNQLTRIIICPAHQLY